MKTTFLMIFGFILTAALISAQFKTDLQKPAGTGIRIAWDYNTLKRVSPEGQGGGYARLIQLYDKSLLAIYEAGGSTVSVKSTDLGNTWSAPVVIARSTDGVGMAVPDVLELKDHSILASYNPRPGRNAKGKRFGIRSQKSYDGGLTWKDERVLYEADSTFQNGCWEPSAIQLPGGEIQLFFANEGDYLTTNEQNISMVRSLDNGLTWSKSREIVSFRPNSRDGMPVPVLSQNGKDILFAIEDNGFKNFKPYIIRSTIVNNWANTVGPNSADRSYALAEPIQDSIYAGAPYLRQLKTGQFILSYQGTEDGRINKLNNTEMKVVIGDESGRNFSHKSVPFVIAPNKSALWNSLSVLSDNTVVAVTGTSTYSGSNRSEIWMIKGHVIPEVTVEKEKIQVDGNADEKSWKSLPVFIGHKSATQLWAGMAYDNQYLYVYNKVNDRLIAPGSGTADNGDGVSISIDAKNKLTEQPDKGIFEVFLSASNKLLLKEGNSKNWEFKSETSSIKHEAKISPDGYVQEIAIPWALLGGKPAQGSRIGYNMRLIENSGGGIPVYRESIAGNSEDKPSTWSTLILK